MGKSLQVGDWKLLYILSKNMEALAYEEFLHELSRLHQNNWTSNENKSALFEQQKLIMAPAKYINEKEALNK